MQPTIHPQKADPYERGTGPDPYQAYRRAARSPRSTRLTIDRTVRILVGVAAAAAVGWLLWYFANLVIYLAVGVLLSYLMRPVVDRLQGVGLGRIPAILVTFVLFFGGLTILVTEMVPFMARQVADLSDRLALSTAAQVVAVEGRGPAPGLQSGDLVVAVDGAPWTGYDQLHAVVETKRSGEQVSFEVEREDGVRRTVALRVRDVAAAAEPVPAGEAEAGPVRITELGLTVEEVTVSAAVAALERQIREVVPLEPGTLLRGLSEGMDQLLQEERITRFAGSVVVLFKDIFYALIVIPFVAFFGLKDGLKIRHGLLRMAPNRYFEITLAILEKIEFIVGRYFKALFAQCLSVATVATVLLYVVGLDYALAVGFFAGLANTIPYFGPLIGFIVGTLVGIVQAGDLSLVPGVIVAMALTRLADDVFFQPFLFSRAAQMHPLVILFVVLMGAQLAGLVGMLLAIPVTTIVRVIVEQVLWSLRNYRILQNA